jgi:hypothetical protein
MQLVILLIGHIDYNEVALTAMKSCSTTIPKSLNYTIFLQFLLFKDWLYSIDCLPKEVFTP